MSRPRCDALCSSEQADAVNTVVCNRAKGSDIASVDAESGEVVRLYSPRSDNWHLHFDLAGDGRIRARTAIARATLALLRMNRPEQIELRSTLMKIGLYPPETSPAR